MTPTVSIAECLEWCPSELAYDYLLYGLRLRSSLTLTLTRALGGGDRDLELLPGAPGCFENIISQLKLDASDWIHVHDIPGAWSYVRYDGNFDFLISPSGNRIFYRLLSEVSLESFQTYALGRVLSLALIKMGVEPLHAATVVVDGRAVAFLGASTFGKSSLAACFVAGNHPLLTDDVLRVQEENGRFLAFPGPPRLKLYPEVASLFVREGVQGLQMDPRSEKFVFPLSPPQSQAAPVPLAVVYAITAPWDIHLRHRIQIEAHSPKDALMKVLSFTTNNQVADKGRLERQFVAARRLIEVVPVRKLTYPRVISSLPEVREAVLADLQRSKEW